MMNFVAVADKGRRCRLNPFRSKKSDRIEGSGLGVHTVIRAHVQFERRMIVKDSREHLVQRVQMLQRRRLLRSVGVHHVAGRGQIEQVHTFLFEQMPGDSHRPVIDSCRVRSLEVLRSG